MAKYISQLLIDIAYATENVSWPFVEEDGDLHDWIPPDEEERTAAVRDLEEWTGIRKEQLPPPEMLSDTQVVWLLSALKAMLDAYNWSLVLQIEVPERIQYAALRDNFNQPAKVKRWHYGFFELCRPGTEHGKCALGEYCQCAFYTHFFSGFTDEELTPEEDRARALEIEISYLKRRHGSNWMMYYPYHLDAQYDDDSGNPFHYGVDDEDEKDDWWKK
jgi:hypothetical protein